MVAGIPRIVQHRRPERLEVLDELVPHVVERLTEDGPPFLGPFRVLTRGATAVCSPPLDSVGAAPRGALDDSCDPRRGMLGEESAVGRQLDFGIGLQLLDRPCQRHLTVTVVVAVGFPVGGHMRQTGPIVRLAQRLHQSLRQQCPVLEQAVECDLLGEWTVVEEDSDAATTEQLDFVRHRGVDRATDHVDPGPLLQDRSRLIGRQDGESDAGVGHQLQALEVYRRLWQPHALRITTEPMDEVGLAPQDLSSFVAPVGQREDGVVVGLCHGCAMSVETGH